MKIAEDRREGVIVFRCSGGWELRQDEIANRVEELLAQGERRFVFNLSHTPGADWLAGELAGIAARGQSTDIRVLFVLNEDWRRFLEMAKLTSIMKISGSEDEAVAELLEWP